MVSPALSSVAQAAPWLENKQFFAENKNLGSSMVDAADLDNDGYVDLVFANGSGYDKGTPDAHKSQQAYHNDAGVSTTDISDVVFGNGFSANGRAVKLRDVDGDGDIDIVLGTTWQSQSQLYLNDGAGNFKNETDSHMPQVKASIGDLELGDVDGDGDLDIVLADWGQASPVSAQLAGGVTQLWTQMGVNTGMFEDSTLARMPNVSIRWAWDVELVDVNNDYTLDILVSCFACDKNSVYLFANDGDGNFIDVTSNITGQGQEGLDVEAVDLNGDSFMDLVTLHDAVGGRNRVLINDKMGGFEDKSDIVWPKIQNPSSYDHMVAILDYNSDGLPDLAIGATQPGDNKYPERLIQNQAGKFMQNVSAFEEVSPSPGTYAIVLADFNLDRVLDMAMSQNENADEKKVLLGTAELAPDTAAPRLPNYEKLANDIAFGQSYSLRVRSHDNKSPVMPHDFQRKENEFKDGRPYLESWSTDPGFDLEANPGTLSASGVWYGEALWKIGFTVPDEGDRFAYRICAVDAAHNKACTEIETIDKPVEETDTDTSTTDNCNSGCTTTDITTDGTGDAGTAGPTESETTAGPTTGFPPDLTTTSDTTGAGDDATFTDTLGELDDDGCDTNTDTGVEDGGCICNGRSGRSSRFLAFLLVLARRRRRVSWSSPLQRP